MPSEIWPEKVLLLYEGSNFGGDFDLSFVNGFKAHGCEVTCIQRGKPWLPPFDLILGYGPFTYDDGSILPVAKQLSTLPAEDRPIFVWWLTEGIPNPHYPDWFVNNASRLRLQIDRLLSNGSFLSRSAWRNLLLRGHRLRIFGQLRYVRDLGLLDVLAITCQSRAEYYRGWGFDPIVVPLGYDQVYGDDLGLERDVDVAFLGNTSARRRQRLLPGLLAELETRGIQLVVKNHLYDDARTEFLNRCRILLNVLREPEDFVGQRFLLAAANKTLVVSEEIIDDSPFVPSQHLAVTPLSEMANKVQFYLDNEEKRQEIVNRSYRFVTEELTITKMIGLILDRARQVKASKRKLF